MVTAQLAGIEPPYKQGVNWGWDRSHGGILVSDFDFTTEETNLTGGELDGVGLPVTNEQNPASLSAPPPSPP